jgi:hypothetical protein
MAADKIFDAITEIVKRIPVTVVILTFLVFLLSAQLTQNAEYAQGFETYFSKEHKEYKNFILFSKNFGSTDKAYVFIKGDDVVNYETFEYMLMLGKVLGNIDGIGEVKSPAHSVAKFYGYIPQNEKTLKELAYRYAAFYLPKKTFALMELEVVASEKNYGFLAEEIEKRLELVPRPHGVFVEATGDPLVRYQIEQSIGGGMAIMGLASIVLMTLILAIVFSGIVRKKRFLFLPLLLSVLTATIAYGLMPLMGIPLTEVTNAFLPVIIGLSIEYAAQFQSRYEEERRKGFLPVEAASNSIKSVGLALSLAMITTVIGFLSMIYSGVPSLSWFGIVCATGLVIAYILSITFLPSVLILFDRDKESYRITEESKKSIMDKGLSYAATKTATHPGTILFLSVIIVIGGYYGYTHVNLETDFFKYIPQDLPAIRKVNELKRMIGSQDTIILVMESDGIDTDSLRQIDEMSKYIVKSDPQIIEYSSITTLIRNYNKGLFPENEYELEKILDRISEGQKERYLSGNSIAIYYTVSPMDWLKFKDLYNRLQEEIKFFGVKSGYYLTGDVVLRMFVADLIINGQNRMTLMSFALVFILLLFVYRSLRKSVVPLLPITAVIAIVGGFMYVFGIDRTIVTASLNSLTIGLGIDFSIHVMERYFEERRKGKSPEEAVQITVENIGKAIMTSGLTMAGGFGAMLISPFPMLTNFGLVTLCAIIFSLISALTIVPAFLVYTENLMIRVKNSGIQS